MLIAITWPKRDRRWLAVRIICSCLYGLVLVSVMFAWTVAKKQDEPWSNVSKLTSYIERQKLDDEMLNGWRRRLSVLPPRDWEATKRISSHPRNALEVETAAVRAKCFLSDGNSACEMRCMVSNSGIVPVKDVTVGFQSMFPALTRVAADSDAGITLTRSETLPLADAAGAFPDVLAFTVHIPMIPPRTTLRFTLWTASEDNQRACRQLTKIHGLQQRIMDDFYKAILQANAASPTELPQLSLVLSAAAKQNNLFVPGAVASETGRVAVGFLTSEEKQASDSYSRVDKRFRPIFPQVFQNRGACVGPVFTLEQTSGDPLYLMRVTPYVTELSASVRVPEIPKGGLILEMSTVPPKEYYCTAN